MDSLKRLSSQAYHEGIWDALKEQDEHVYQLINKEYERLQNTLQLIAAENLCTRAVLAALGSIVQNKTTEGFPHARFHGGCDVVDDIEELAVARAKETFKAQYANVQPHSGTAANQIVLVALLESGDRILSLELNQGGHVSHGANVSFGGKFFDVENYFVDRQTYRLDVENIRQKALEFKPKLIICGGSAYARTIDFQQFRRIADEVGAYLMADISHIAGLIIAGAHPSPIDAAHFSTTSTYKPGGPRGGLILMGKDFDRQIEVSGKKTPLWRLIQKTTFPGVQGTPYLNNIAAKAIFFKETLSEEYRSRQFRIVENAARLAENLLGLGYDVVTDGTDNHMILINIANLREGMTGAIAQECLEECGIIINKNRLPYDTRNAAVASGARLGTPIVTRNGMGPDQMDTIAGLFDTVLRGVKIVSEREYELDNSLKDDTRRKIMELCHEFPMS
ncbi:MAG: serine hydroxymethyltransferase [Sedimentisphaerales bacterium]|nr:serine hydroxymethyltransferase [Sedimentisphaerales bacterium]